MQELTAGRLIPLDKGLDKDGNIGIRPIGIGETLRRIIGKSVMSAFKADLQKAGGCLQTCSGTKSGIEAAIHATHEAWKNPSTECVLQVDADNAFNRLNRKVALHNVRQLCPSIHTFLLNHYQRAAHMTMTDSTQQETLLSDEGCTQGDPAAMPFYSVGVRPLIDHLAASTNADLCKQAWYADDSSAAGKLAEVVIWWQQLNELGPKFGYFPKASKSVLILKDPSLLQQARHLFSGTDLQIMCDGQKHLGAVIGHDNCKTQYVTSKVSKWIDDVKDLSQIANEEPQAALSSFTKSLCHRWTFVQRTIPDTRHLFAPLEECITEVFIPALLGRNVSALEREILSLPVRFSGLGITNPTESADREYNASKIITENLASLILQQQQDISLYDAESTNEKIKNLKNEKERYLVEKFERICESIEDTQLRRCLHLNKGKGAGSWLTALPLQNHGYCLNKQEFRDAVSLRYGWRIPNTPQYCGCGKKNDVDHTLICAKGGYVAMRHNALRDLNAEFQSEVCRDVKTEPRLLPLNNEEVEGTSADRAAPDISSRGLWSTFQRTFFDVRVFHPNAPSYKDRSMEALYKTHEQEKMRMYNSRVMLVEKGTFTPLVYSTFGGWSPQATSYHKRLAELISRKRNEEYHHVMSHIRTKVRFSLLRSVLVAVRGERGRKTSTPQPLCSTSFNLIPQSQSYECY